MATPSVGVDPPIDPHIKKGLYMDLEKQYKQVSESLSRLDFDAIWPGFAPLKFALYNAEKCFFDGQYIEKTDAFCANTSIEYNGEQIAIWMLQEELEIPVLTSKIVHEMFHGFQTKNDWDCWPNEREALYHYQYRPENLSLKLQENELLLTLLDGFEEAPYRELLGLRKLRSQRFPYEFSYESRVEEIEGTANYVEWQTLKQLDAGKAEALAERMGRTITTPTAFFPIRISCYATGALLIHALRQAGDYDFAPFERPLLPALLEAGQWGGQWGTVLFGLPSQKEPSPTGPVTQATAAFLAESEAIIQAALEKNEIVLEGPLELLALNIYDARCHKGYLTSTYFIMVREGEEEKMLPGNFVLKMRDEKTIETVYRW